MSTEIDLNQALRDPLSLPEGFDMDAFAEGASPDDLVSGEASERDGDGESTNSEGDNDGGAPDTSGRNQPGEKAGEKDEPEGGSKVDPEGSVIKSKDGKYEIPYEVLRSERERRLAAETMARELTEKLELERQAAASGRTAKTADLSEIVDEDLMAQLREESPQLAEVLDKLVDRVKTQHAEIEAARPAAEQAQRDRQVSAMSAIEDAIEANPKLLHARTHDPDQFNGIAEVDAYLRTQARFKDLPLDERFAKAVAMYEAANGVIELPNAKPAAVPAKPAATPADTQARLDAAIKKANAATGGPNTLSDIPGGALPATDAAGEIEEMSGIALTNKLLSMTPDQQEAYLARLT